MLTRLRAIRVGTAIVGLAVCPLVCAERGRAQSGSADQTVARIGDYVARYYERAQSLVAEESVAVQPLDRDLTPLGFARRLLYEFRLEWNPDAIGDESPATITRTLLAINGKPPRPRDEPKCLDPRSVSPEPLAFLLPDRRDKFTFASAGVGRFDGRSAVMVDYRSVKRSRRRRRSTKRTRTASCSICRVDRGGASGPTPRPRRSSGSTNS
jgi:hypothetical protein